MFIIYHLSDCSWSYEDIDGNKKSQSHVNYSQVTSLCHYYSVMKVCSAIISNSRIVEVIDFLSLFHRCLDESDKSIGIALHTLMESVFGKCK